LGKHTNVPRVRWDTSRLDLVGAVIQTTEERNRMTVPRSMATPPSLPAASGATTNAPSPDDLVNHPVVTAFSGGLLISWSSAYLRSTVIATSTTHRRTTL
jgi:hypothetical protein